MSNSAAPDRGPRKNEAALPEWMRKSCVMPMRSRLARSIFNAGAARSTKATRAAPRLIARVFQVPVADHRGRQRRGESRAVRKQADGAVQTGLPGYNRGLPFA